MNSQLLEIATLLQMIIAALSGQATSPEANTPQPTVQDETEMTTSSTDQKKGKSDSAPGQGGGANQGGDETEDGAGGDGGGSAPPESTSGDMPILTFDEDDFDHVFDGTEITSTANITNVNNVLIKNCHVHDTAGDGIVIRNATNVVITNCTFEDIGGQAAVRGSITGSSDGVLLYDNVVDGTAENGFNFGQRYPDGVDHTNLRIIGNSINDTGLQSSDGSKHSIYVQAQEFEISYNTISGNRDGNAISVRSSGEVIGNTISGTSADDKPGIRYYSDHQTGPSETLLIEGNVVDEARIGIDLFTPVNRYDGQTGYSHVVKDFIITDNDVSGSDTGIAVAPAYNSSPFSVTGSGNID